MRLLAIRSTIFKLRLPKKLVRRRIVGLTLVELMVAITIGLIILAAVTRLFVSSRSTYNLEENLARVQESGRFAMEFLAQDIRMAGYAGCSANLSGSEVSNLVSPATSAATFNPDGITGYRYACTSSCSGALTEWDPDLPASYFPAGNVSPMASTDVIVLQRADTISTNLTGNTTADNANIQVLSTSAMASVQAGDILMVSNCTNVDVFKATSVSSGSGIITIAHTAGNTANTLSASYDNSAEIMRLVTRIYFIGQRSSGAPPSLYRRELASNASLTTQELVEGVEVMRLLYGVDTDSERAPNQYIAPSASTNWRRVLTARVGLLVKTTSDVDPNADTRTYDLAGTTVGPYNDKVRRRAFSETVRVRNHF